MTLHLTHEQLCDLVLADSSLPFEDEAQNPLSHDPSIVQAHLPACLLCSAELKVLRDSLSHFRDASTAYARQEFAHSYAQRSSITPPHSFLSQPLYWTAAVVVFAAALFPLSMHRQHQINSAMRTSASASQQESDEALLADIDQKVSADVPSPMEPLADPIDDTASTTSTTNQRNN